MNERASVSRTRIVFVVIVLAALSVAFIGGRKTAPKALGGRFDNVGLIQVKGQLRYVELFCNYYKADNQCKFIVAVEVEEAVQVGDGPTVLDVPLAGDVQAVDMPDSRMNLYIEQDSKHCTGNPDGIEVCTYSVKGDMKSIVYIYKEEVGSSGLPEYVGTPR